MFFVPLKFLKFTEGARPRAASWAFDHGKDKGREGKRDQSGTSVTAGEPVAAPGPHCSMFGRYKVLSCVSLAGVGLVLAVKSNKQGSWSLPETVSHASITFEPFPCRTLHPEGRRPCIGQILTLETDNTRITGSSRRASCAYRHAGVEG